MGNNKDFKKFESFLVCIIITILMVLAGIYTDILKKYCILSLLIWIWPLNYLILRKEMTRKRELVISVCVWAAISIFLFGINAMVIKRNNSEIWWCIFPIIGIACWPISNITKYIGGKKE